MVLVNRRLFTRHMPSRYISLYGIDCWTVCGASALPNSFADMDEETPPVGFCPLRGGVFLPFVDFKSFLLLFA